MLLPRTSFGQFFRVINSGKITPKNNCSYLFKRLVNSSSSRGTSVLGVLTKYKKVSAFKKKKHLVLHFVIIYMRFFYFTTRWNRKVFINFSSLQVFFVLKWAYYLQKNFSMTRATYDAIGTCSDVRLIWMNV